MRRLVTLVVLCAATRAFADPKLEAKKHVEKAMQAHADSKWDEALGELTLAYSLDPQPALLYAIGQVHVKLGHCQQAIDFYERFLASHPAQGPAAEAHQAIDACQKHTTLEPLADNSKPVPHKPVPLAPAPAPAPPPAPPPAERGEPAFYSDLVGDALVAAGLLSGVIA